MPRSDAVNFSNKAKKKEKAGHIMISYQWDYQELMLKVMCNESLFSSLLVLSLFDPH